MGSRLKDMLDAKIKPRLPPCGLPYLVDLLMEVGPYEHGEMGPRPLSQLEILAFQMNTGRRLQPDEVMALRALSAVWVSETQRAADPSASSPWEDDAGAEDQLTANLDALRRRSPVKDH